VHSHYAAGSSLFDAVRRSVAALVGAYAIAVIGRGRTRRIVVARMGAPLLLGLREGESFAASDASALCR